MGLLADIQNDAVSDLAPVATMLRKCMVLAHNLESAVLEDWVKWELNGYPKDVEVPNYRRINLSFKVTAANAFTQYNGLSIPQAVLCDVTGDDKFDVFQCRQAIGTISVDEIKASKGTMSLNMDNHALLLPGRVIDDSLEVVRFWAEMPSSKILGIVDAVRNRVLEFVLALQKEHPNAGEVRGMPNSEQTSGQAVSQIFNTTINGGNAGVIGSASHSTVTVMVNHGSFEDLRRHLTDSGVSKEDAAALEEAVKSEPRIGEDKKFGPKVTAWVGGMLGKAASGVWGVGLASGGALLEKALLGYYGY